jgi:chromosome segregation ATPase
MSNEIKQAFGINDSVDKKAADFLASALNKALSPDFDYMKYRQSLHAMRDLSLDEAIAFKSAYAAAQSMGLKKDDLAKSAGRYMEVLVREKKQFDDALGNQVNERVNAKRDEVVKLQQRIEELKQKIREYEQKIGEYQNKIDTADDVVAEARRKIDETKQRFESAYQTFVDLINKDLELIQKYL